MDDDLNKRVDHASLEACNNEVKTFKKLMKHMLGNLNGFSIVNSIQFDDLTSTDKLTFLKLCEFLSAQQSIMDTTIDIKKYYRNFKDFMATFVVPFYLDFSKHRLLTQKGTREFDSAQKMTFHLLNTLMIQAAPITIFTCQDLFSHMPIELFEGGIKPKTVF